MKKSSWSLREKLSALLQGVGDSSPVISYPSPSIQSTLEGDLDKCQGFKSNFNASILLKGEILEIFPLI
jgi:hypothetical protein